MSAREAKQKFDEKHMNASFEHARELSFAEDFETAPAEEDKLSKTANFFGDFYFTGETAGAKAMASKVVYQELREMRERLNWGTLTSTKQIPKEEFQTQLSKSRFLSLFLVMRRVTGRFQLNQKKKAFRNWVEWYKHYMVLYRSRPVSRSNPGSRSASPNNSFRSVRFFHNQSDAGSVSTSSTHNHPRNYHFHGDRNMSPQQLRKELHLHRDIYLTSEDEDVQETLMRRVHPHAANHPEMEEKSRFASPKERAAARKPDVKHAKASVPSHIVKKHIVVSAQALNQNRPDSPSSTVASYNTLGGHHVHAQKKVSAKKLKKELHLHHDMFLTSQDDDVAQALLHHAYAHSPNHPELEYKPNGHSFSNRGGAHSPPVPSHVVPKRSPSPSGDQSAALRARSLSPTRSTASVGAHAHARDLSPQQLKKELHLHHDLFLTSQDDDVAQAVLYRALPHSPNHAPAEALSRFASPKRRAAARLEAEKKAAAQTKAAHNAPHHAARDRSPSPSRQAAGAPGQPHGNQRGLSPQQLRKDLHLHHDMFLTSEDDVVADALLHKANAHSPNRTTRGNFNLADGTAGGASAGTEAPAAKKITCRHLDTIAGSRKEAHALHKADPVSHVKAVASGKHHNIAVKPITPSLYSSGVTSAGLKAFNVSKDKKHDPKPKLSHSPSRVLPVEHAETVGIKVDQEELRAGTPTKTLARALSILVTPASDAVKHDHRVKPHHVLGRTLTALSITGHEAIVGAVVASPQSPPEPEEDSESSYDTDSDDEDQPHQRDSRLSGLDLSKGLSIRTDMATNDGTASVSTSSASPTRRNSFHAPTVSHILKLAHRSDSVEKVASKVKEKRSKVKQTLPKSPHPSQVFTIIPDELIAKRAERRTSFRSPTKSHAIKVAAKLGGDDVGSVLGSVSGSPSSLNKPERRKSFADSLERDSSINVENGVYSIRTIIPFSGMNNSGASASFLSTTPAGPAPSIYGTPGKLVRRGSTVASLGPNSAPAKVGGGVSYTYPTNNNTKNGTGGAGTNKASVNRTSSGVKFEDGGDDASTVQGDDDASVCVYNVDDDLINLFDPTSPKFKKGMTPKNRNRAGANTSTSAANTAGNTSTNSTSGTPGTPKYRPGSAKHIAQLKKQADDKKTAALDVIFQHLDTHHGKVGKTTSTKVAFNTWRAAVGWFKKVDERVPQSILYLLQVEKETLWRVFCVYCPDKRAIPASPPVTTVTAVLSDAAVERLTTGYSAHHDHHTHAPEVFHAYQDIHATHHATPAEVDAERIKRDAYLHRDIFLHTQDDDVAEVLLHQSHRHAANHPEQGIIVHHEKTQHIHETPVPHHDLTIKLGPHQHEVDKHTLRRDLHLHHDMFLGSEEADVIEVTMHHAHPHAANHPEEGLVGDHGYVHPPAPIIIPPVHHTPSAAHAEKHGDHCHEAHAHDASHHRSKDTTENTADENAMLERMNSKTPPPPNTPLYGLFTVVEDEDGHEADQSPDHSRTLSPVPKLNYGPNPANSSPAEKEVPMLAVPKSMHLQIVPAPSMNGNTEGMPPSEIVAMHASTRFKKKLMDIDGLWNLFQDFNVVPYLFNKMKLRELFERSVSIQPDSPAAPVVPENNPLSHMPNFNVYSYDAPGRDDERNSPRSSPRNSPRNSPRSSPRTSPERRPSHDAIAKSLRARSSSPTRRGSTESAASTTSASAKRMNRIIETVTGNGTRRAFKSPDGKVMIKLTSFRAPSAIEIDTTYIAKVTNPRSKAPDVLNAIKMKKKADDDFAKAIVEANRKAAEEKALAERNRRRAGPNTKLHATLSAQNKASSSPELRTGKCSSVPNLKNLTPGTTQIVTVGSGGSGGKRQPSPERTHLSPGKSRSIGDLQLYHVEPHSPHHHHPTISFKSFVKLLWEVAASYMDITEDDAQAIAALRAFVHVLTRYKARMVTKEVEKVLPLLAHDRELGHKATRMF